MAPPFSPPLSNPPMSSMFSTVVLVGRTNCRAAQECLRLATNPELPNTPLIRWLSPFIKLVQSLHIWAL
ncbi:hypothetical protein K503DRAFT_775737 [Rhizopogon vinicolor AM-OR11-026]|uniref:Uncharacterized protein n=1 Tax=Rhizopogon vinicolor AM-OR11-026 TaxID=1314800 RepID=A0A1B7ML31_9AGAM|nr:hypothetical protein K503DRAFT_775737 [Rhizopogon vinicolor AM-OR11-026]